MSIHVKCRLRLHHVVRDIVHRTMRVYIKRLLVTRWPVKCRSVLLYNDNVREDALQTGCP